MRTRITIALVFEVLFFTGCSNDTEKKFYVLAAQVTATCTTIRDGWCSRDRSLVEATRACLEQARASGISARLDLLSVTDDGFIDQVSLITSNHKVWFFSQLANGLGGIHWYKHVCDGPVIARDYPTHRDCFTISAEACDG